jgi:hypothetical protein
MPNIKLYIVEGKEHSTQGPGFHRVTGRFSDGTAGVPVGRRIESPSSERAVRRRGSRSAGAVHGCNRDDGDERVVSRSWSSG